MRGSSLRVGFYGSERLQPKCPQQGPGVDLVTQYDEACEEAIRGLARGMPGVAVLGEEGSGSRMRCVGSLIHWMAPTTLFTASRGTASRRPRVSGSVEVGVVLDPPEIRMRRLAERVRGAQVSVSP